MHHIASAHARAFFELCGSPTHIGGVRTAVQSVTTILLALHSASRAHATSARSATANPAAFCGTPGRLLDTSVDYLDHAPIASHLLVPAPGITLVAFRDPAASCGMPDRPLRVISSPILPRTPRNLERTCYNGSHIKPASRAHRVPETLVRRRHTIPQYAFAPARSHLCRGAGERWAREREMHDARPPATCGQLGRWHGLR
jgi:hypothetical protein